MHIAGLHDPLGDRRRWYALVRTTVAVSAALGLYLLVLYFSSLEQLGRTILVRVFLLSVVFLGGSRVLFWRLSKVAPRRIGCVLGEDKMQAIEALVSRHHPAICLVKAPAREDAPGPEAEIEALIREGVDEILVATSEQRVEWWLASLRRGVQVTDVALFVEREYYKIACDEISLSWILNIDLQWNHPFYHRLKRILDLLVAGVGLIVSSPVVLLAALAIWLEGGGAVFYSQIRTGFLGRPYRIYKLRTMRTDAEKSGAQWAKQGDARVTFVGRILRRTRIDELPQFWNILKGEMSLIGPRPERPEFVEQLDKVIPLYAQRHWIKPGLTGWAQINYPYGASVEDAREKLCYDLYYLKNASLLLDLHIALRTIGAVMKGSR